MPRLFSQSHAKAAIDAELDQIARNSTSAGVFTRLMESTPISPNDFAGATQHDRMEAAVQFIAARGWGVLELGVDTVSQPNTSLWIRNSALMLPDNCWVYLNNATYKMANGVFDNMMRNDGIVPNPDPFMPALELNENRNIRVYGNDPDTCFMEGPEIVYTAPHPINGGESVKWVGDWYGWRVIGILFANAKETLVQGITFRKTTGWAISHEHGCESMVCKNLKFATTVKNGDGVNIRKGCKHGRIKGISGTFSDDAVAINALLIEQTFPYGNYIYPFNAGGSGSNPLGNDIDDIVIEDIQTNSQVDIITGGGGKVSNVSVTNVSDLQTLLTGYHLVWVRGVSSYGGTGAVGDITNIYVNDIRSDFSSVPFRVRGNMSGGQVNKIRQGDPAEVLYTIDPGYTQENLSITNAEYVA